MHLGIYQPKSDAPKTEEPNTKKSDKDKIENPNLEINHKKDSHKADSHEHAVTPLEERQGKPNSQIVYSPEEIKKAKANGQTTTSDGYIFDAKDIINFDGQGYTTPHMDHIHYTLAKDLSKEERKAAQEFWEKHKEQLLAKKKENHNKANEILSDNHKYKAKNLIDLYKEVPEKLVVPLNKMYYQLQYTTHMKGNDTFVQPHHDHFHYVSFDMIAQMKAIPEGYTIADVFSTVKYLINHPESRPMKDGWESKEGHITQPEENESPVPTERPKNQQLLTTVKDIAYAYTYDASNWQQFETKLKKWMDEYEVSIEEMQFYDNGVVGFPQCFGSTIYIDEWTEEEVSLPQSAYIIGKLVKADLYENATSSYLKELSTFYNEKTWETLEAKLFEKEIDLNNATFYSDGSVGYKDSKGKEIYINIKELKTVANPSQNANIIGQNGKFIGKQNVVKSDEKPKNNPSDSTQASPREKSKSEKPLVETKPEEPKNNETNIQNEQNEGQDVDPEMYAYESKVKSLSAKYGMNETAFEDAITKIGSHYRVSMDQIQFNDVLTFTSQGKTIRYDIVNGKEL
ncbi:streptococcal histidine triad protein [Streptococcus urinalis FB127-CNA-2]|uniref:Histidine triad protein n=1 Tax=Streptococcus urinalis 2285-97 TaxID=764291 RepID=G5KFV9_9STRE|nr:histidine triad protein [Streptococcus urinalis 2285-97]EKS22169.1 streptococcal histidine triad protein [Streptococcus urinalis FB127-CNA-2]VEF31981.1 histidine triad protein [Streptococcus urinalis]